MHTTSMVSLLSTVLALAGSTLGHMEMQQPYALRSKYNPANKGGGGNDVDYSMTSPLEADGSNYPCKGYQNDRPVKSVATYKAGSKQQLKLSGSATHGGGSCQISLSYDNGKTFRVIKSMIGGCPLTSNYDFTVPTYAPNGTALLAWSWQNKEGNREFYMNCAEVDIDAGGSDSSSHSGQRRDLEHRHLHSRAQSFSSFNDLPYIWVANLPDQNKCATTEGEEPVYPDPGPDVQYAAGLSASSPKAAGTGCDSPTPPGKTYKDLPVPGGSSEGASDSGAPAAPAAPSKAPSSSAAASSASPPSASSSAAYSGNLIPENGSAQPTSTAAPVSALTPSSTYAAMTSSAAPYSPPSSPGGSSGSGGSGSGAGTASGTCSTPGQMKCTNGGKGFAVCDNGRWMDMGAVASGTTCTGQGQIGAAARS
ncbi:MAG: hypothetical protein M1828_006644 [Chrysothrix sp. TS-e1954]|nr:MAG: hypothetical protein M1828_006644 [Chrysothrix sp. TS-e1954]